MERSRTTRPRSVGSSLATTAEISSASRKMPWQWTHRSMVTPWNCSFTRSWPSFGHFMKSNYHKPSDDLAQPINYDAGAKFAKLNAEIARELGDAAARPEWNNGDFFAARFKRK